MKETSYSPLIGKEYPCFIVAEAGINHNGDLQLAKMLAKEAKEADADAVKFQSFIGEKELRYPNITYGETVELKKYCDSINILFFSTPHSITAIDNLEPIVPIYKIASTFLVKVLFVDEVMRRGKPVIISVNEKASPSDVSLLEDYWKDRESPPIYPLHTVCEYPASNPMFAIMENRQKRHFIFDWGYSDHTKGIKNCIKAVEYFNACIIEKHFKIADNCVDSSHAVGKSEFKEMVNEIRKAEVGRAKAEASGTDKVEVAGELPRKPKAGGKR